MPEPKSPPLVALWIRWVMLRRRLGIIVPSEVVDVVACVAERHNAREGRARAGNYTLFWDTGSRTKDRIRRWLLQAVELGAIIYRPGRGRGHASEIEFTESVWNAPQLDGLARLDRQRVTEAAARGESPPLPGASMRERKAQKKGAAPSPFRTGKRAHSQPRKGRDGNGKRARSCAPPTVVTASTTADGERPSAAVSATHDNKRPTDNGNGALKETLGGESSPSHDLPGVAFRTSAQPLSRVEKFRASMTPSRPYEPLSEDARAERERILAEQQRQLLGEDAARSPEALP